MMILTIPYKTNDDVVANLMAMPGGRNNDEAMTMIRAEEGRNYTRPFRGRKQPNLDHCVDQPMTKPK